MNMGGGGLTDLFLAKLSQSVCAPHSLKLTLSHTHTLPLSHSLKHTLSLSLTLCPSRSAPHRQSSSYMSLSIAVY